MRYRLARAEDLEAGSHLIHPGLKLAHEVQARLAEIWSDLMASGAARFVVFEDPALPYPESIEAVGVTAFARKCFIEGFLERPAPYITALVYEQLLAGKSPLLTGSEVRSANSGEGLNLLSLHFALRHPDLTHPRTEEVLVLSNTAFFFFHGGYRLNCAIAEVYGREQADYNQAGGFPLYTDFAADFPSQESASLEQEHPFLFLLRKEDVLPSAVNPLSYLFYPLTPRIWFSTMEQKVLERGLLNESDEGICENLGVSLDTVKKTWRRIYERVDREMPQLLGPEALRPERGSRGSEKRRHLLEYMRVHLEELRPWRRDSAKSPARIL
jgi:hypothetical protein